MPVPLIDLRATLRALVTTCHRLLSHYMSVLLITIEGDINGIPVVDFETCDGCGVCLSACPGLAIFGVDLSGESETATVRVPYEFLPLPEAGETVVTLDREGNVVGEARVARVLDAKALDRTPIVSLEVPREKAMEVRHFRRKDARP